MIQISLHTKTRNNKEDKWRQWLSLFVLSLCPCRNVSCTYIMIVCSFIALCCGWFGNDVFPRLWFAHRISFCTLSFEHTFFFLAFVYVHICVRILQCKHKKAWVFVDDDDKLYLCTGKAPVDCPVGALLMVGALSPGLRWLLPSALLSERAWSGRRGPGWTAVPPIAHMRCSCCGVRGCVVCTPT